MLRIITANYKQVIKEIKSKVSYINRPEEKIVKGILEDVRINGNMGLIKYINKFEAPNLVVPELRVSQTEIDIAHGKISDEILEIIRRAINNIRSYHKNFKLESWSTKAFSGSKLGMKITPIHRVGVYVPGGTASYPSTVLMNVIPAQIAGVSEIVLISPSDKTGCLPDMTLAVAKELGITEVYRMGGAQGIAALAYGTEDIEPVQKIVGPGNIYVTLAKKEVFGVVGIDKLAGPSDICIVADKLSNTQYIAADMLAQAEHDKLASAILITDSPDIAARINNVIEEQIEKLPRQEILRESLQENSAIFVVSPDDNEQIIDLVNYIAPEHLEIVHGSYQKLMDGITNAGAMFIGEYSAEVLGDYVLGPNHVLPTGGTATFSSPLSVIEFQKASSVIEMERKDYAGLGEDTAKFADLEGLTAHAKAARIRL